jgi:hypothetical protein
MKQKKIKPPKRPTAGKPPLYDKAMQRYNVTLDEDTVEFMKSLAVGKNGKGILAAGIRKAKQIIQGKVR